MRCVYNGVTGDLKVSAYTLWDDDHNRIWTPTEISTKQEGIESLQKWAKIHSADTKRHPNDIGRGFGRLEFWPDRSVNVGCLCYGTFNVAVVCEDGSVEYPCGKRMFNAIKPIKA